MDVDTDSRVKNERDTPVQFNIRVGVRQDGV